jgi:hypothetical protein
MKETSIFLFQKNIYKVAAHVMMVMYHYELSDHDESLTSVGK